MGEHTVPSFDEELEQLDRLIPDMGDLAGAMVGGVDPARCSPPTMRWRSASSPTTPSWTPGSANSTTARSR